VTAGHARRCPAQLGDLCACGYDDHLLRQAEKAFDRQAERQWTAGRLDEDGCDQ